MTLRGKLLLAQAPLAIALAVVGLVAAANISSLGEYSRAILKDNYRSVLAAQRMKEALERLQDLAAQRLLGLETAARVADVARNRQRFEDELRVQEGNLTEPNEGAASQRLRTAWVRYLEAFDHLRSGDDAGARAYYRDELEPRFAAVHEGTEEILTINQDAMVLKSERARRVAERVTVVTIVVALAAMLLGALLAWMLTSRLLQPLGLLSRAVHHIGEGDFEARVDVAGTDELAQLAHTVNTMAGRLSQYRRSSLGELLLAQQASQATIDGLPDPVVVFDLHGAVVTINTAAETLLGLGAKPLTELPPAVREMLERVRTHVLTGKGAYVPKGFEEAVPVASADGERYLLPRATPVYAENGAITSATVVLQDVTRLRRVDELRNDLVATVAHELRTPLTSLRMAIHMCLEHVAGPLTDKQTDLLYAAREDCERLQSMVDELLDLARIQSGRIELQRRPTPPRVLIDTAVDAYRKSAAEHHLALQTLVLPGIREVFADRDRVQLVLSNLLSNAIRHTPAGGSIEVRARALDGVVRFEVADTGEGIPPVQRGRIFEKFVQGENRSAGAAGLGLAISKDVVEAHGGEIGVDDTPGGGATVWFTLPTAAQEPQGRVAV
jgi:PAS domain S-box-containing protein